MGEGGARREGVVKREVFTVVCNHNHKYLKSLYKAADSTYKSPVFIRDSIHVLST